MQQLFGLIGQLMRPKDPQVPQPRSIAPGIWHFVHPVEFKREEQQMGGYRGDALADGLVEFPQRGVRRIAREQQPRIRSNAPEDLVDPLVFRDRRRQIRRRQLPPIGRRERDGRFVGALEIGLQRRAIGRGIQVRQVPGGQSRGFRHGVAFLG